MSTRKTAALDSGLLVRKGEATPSAVGQPPQKRISMTVKLDPRLYVALNEIGLRSQPRKTNQDLIVEAIGAYVKMCQPSSVEV